MKSDELARRLDRLEENLHVMLMLQQESRADASATTELLAWSLQRLHKEDRFDLLELWKQKRAEALKEVQKQTEHLRELVREDLLRIRRLTENPPGN